MARSKRKKNPFLTKTASVSVKEQKRYRAAGYARLSVEDSGKPGAETIENQKQLISDYIETAPDMVLAAFFQDNGKTGTGFQRPGFEAMMDAVRCGEANCIVVKDLSRFGRNYKETGNYLERIFPFLGVRFIAITDGFDSLTAERSANGVIVPLKNLINEAYSRDISRKTASALHTKQRRGDYIGTWAPYGYRKCPEDKHRLVLDPDTAPVVRSIFRMRLEGLSYQNIAGFLNTEGISSPARYLVEAGLCKNVAYLSSVWKAGTVRRILERQVYLGHMVQGLKRRTFYNGKRQGSLPKEEWIITENTHAPIVDKETFITVNSMPQEWKEVNLDQNRSEISSHLQ